MIEVGYIVHDLNDPSVARRCSMLERGGVKVALAGFMRGTQLNVDVSVFNPLILGESKDAAMLSRMVSTLRGCAFNGQLRQFLSNSKIVMARNLEQLAIASQIAGTRRLVYECLDIHRLLVDDSFLGRAVQRVEKHFLARSDALITSSPAFIREHFEAKTKDMSIHLIENKLMCELVPDRISEPKLVGDEVVIGWFGMLRCHATFETLTSLLAASECLKVNVSGKPSTATLPNFSKEVKTVDRMKFSGAYRYSELPDLYHACHFAWAVDWYEEGLNSKWLLPNRIYEALANGVVPILLEGTEQARWASKYGVGLIVQDRDDAIQKLSNLTPENVLELQRSLHDFSPRNVLADDRDCLELVKVVIGE